MKKILLGLYFVVNIITGAYTYGTDLRALNERAFKLAILQDEKEIESLIIELDAISSDSLSDSDKSQLCFLKGFCGYQMISINYGQIKDLMTIFNTAKRSVAESISYDPKNSQAIALQALLTASSLPPGKAFEAVAGTVAELKEMDSNSPFSFFVEGLAKLFTKEGGATYLEKALKNFSKNNLKAELQNNWWYWQTHAVLADIYLGLFKQKPNYIRAHELVDLIKNKRPDMGYLRVIAPLVVNQNKNNLIKSPNVSWTLLAEDEAGDTADPVKVLKAPVGNYDIFDAKSLSYNLDFTTGTVWLKFAFHTFPSDNFGINLMLDVDGDSENGSRWFSNKEFRFDIMATLWLHRDAEGNFIGINGLSTSYDFDRRRMAVLGQDNIKYFVDNKAMQIILGINHQDLGSPQELKVAGAVGSNLYWEDNVPNKGFTVIKP